VETVYGQAAVPGWGLRVVAAIPAAAVLAEMRQEELDDSLLAALIVLGVLALALLISRRIARPIKEIAAVAGEVAAGHLETRAPVRGAAEIAEVAVQLNQMLDVRRQAEETLRHTSQRCQVLSRQLLQIREQERRHIARELHDEIGQALTAVKISLQAMGQPAGAHMQATHKENCIHIVDRALQSVRGLSLDLCPPILDDLGLPAALRWQLDRHARPAGLAVHFSHALDGRPDRDLETACFRIAQEAITNVIRHAEAAEIQVDLCQREAALHLSVCDDGKGFDVRSARQRALAGKSMGLFSMEERVKLLGGRFFLDSAPGRGTDIRAVFPLAAALRGVA
jgi:signal transduction histidine kinase